MFKGLGQLAGLMKQASQIQGRMQDMQETLRRIKVEGSAGGGMIVVEMNGQQQALSCRVDPTLLTADNQEMLEELLVAAVNQAADKAKEAAANEMSKLANGLDLPGLSESLSKMGLSGSDGPT